MKKNIYILITGLLLLGLSGCFKDNGNYLYSELKPPKWLVDPVNNNVNVYCRGGQTAVLDASTYFIWEGDAEVRQKEVRYEWRLNNKVISTQVKEEMPTQELLKRAGLSDYPVHETVGTFAIIEKATGVEFKIKAFFSIKPPISYGDVIVYSAMQGASDKGMMSTVLRNEVLDKDGKPSGFELRLTNMVKDIPGTPYRLSYAHAKNVSYSGSLTAITKEGNATVYDAGAMKRVWDISELFTEGVPPDFKVADRRDQEDGRDKPSVTWVATQDGRLFIRHTGINYLGGKFLSEPYVLDDKGYAVTRFGHSLFGLSSIPVYDKKNHRILLGTNENEGYSLIKSYLTVLDNPNAPLNVGHLDTDIKVFHITETHKLDYTRTQWFTMFYNTPEGEAAVYTFAVATSGHYVTPNSSIDKRMGLVPGHAFTDETVFLTAANARYWRNTTLFSNELFSEGNKIFSIVRSPSLYVSTFTVKEVEIPEVTSKITALLYDIQDYGNYDYMYVGCENGDLLVYYMKPLYAPKLIKKFNLGGRVAAVKQVSSPRATLDYY